MLARTVISGFFFLLFTAVSLSPSALAQPEPSELLHQSRDDLGSPQSQGADGAVLRERIPPTLRRGLVPLSLTSSLPAAAITLGGRASADDTDGFLDVLAPAAGTDTGFIFLNPKASLGETGENEEHVGLGIRKLVLDEGAILGTNIFYDSRESSHSNRFDQLGLGIEFLTEWLDARANYYLPEDGRDVIASQNTAEIFTRAESQTNLGSPFFKEHDVRQSETRTTTTTTQTTTHHFDKFEEAMEGVDFEMGFKVPFLESIAQTRVYGGYYFYNSRFREDLQGFKARIEMRALPGLILDAEWYEDRDLHGSDYYLGTRVRLPFEIGNLFKGKNPFEGSGEYFQRRPVPLKERMTDMVMRDLDVIMEESDLIEDKSKLQVRTQTDVKVEKFDITLLGDITFVDQDNQKSENGTYEHPYDTIQEGVNHAVGKKYVHVQDASSAYEENVTLRDGIKLWGSGYKFTGLESGIRPVVDGRSLGPSITMANNTEIWGMEVINTDTGGPAMNRTVAGETYDIRRAGIYSQNKTNLNISHSNHVHHNEVGVFLAADTAAHFTTVIEDNTLRNNTQEGLKILGQGSGGPFATTISNNTASNNGLDGIQIKAKNYEDITLEITGNTASNNGSGGIMMSDSTTESFIVSKRDLSVNLSRNAANQNQNEGILLAVNTGTSGAGRANVRIDQNIANSNKGDAGISALFAGSGDLSVDISGNTSIQNQTLHATGISLVVEDTTFVGPANFNSVAATINNNTASENGNFSTPSPFSVNVACFIWTLGNIAVDMSGNTANHGASFGMYLSLISDASSVNVSMNNNRASHNDTPGLGRDGLLSDLLAAQDIHLMASNNVFSYNADNGVRLRNVIAGGTADINFGDSSSGLGGRNSLFGNGGAQMVYTDTPAITIKAENNFWNVNPANNPPNDGAEFSQGSGIIDAEPFLTTNPNT